MARINIEDFFQNRDELIDALEAGEIDKTTFFESNLAFFKAYEFVPKAVEKLDFDEAVIHYQYFNIMAKSEFMEEEALSFREPAAAKRHRERGLDFYDLKDRATSRMLDLAQYAGVRAYFIDMHSKALAGELFEIIFPDRERLVLHSKDKRILQRLRNAGVFDEELQPSIIQEYVNTRYK